MWQIINQFFTWLVNGIKDIFNIIVSIPKYTTVLFNYLTLLPVGVLPFFSLMLTAFIIICIKRLVFD